MNVLVDFDHLVSAAEKLGIDRALIEIWIPRSEFVKAVVDGENLSITRRAEPFFGWAFGRSPIIDPEWPEFAVNRSTPKEKTSGFTLQGQWDAYGIHTHAIDSLDENSYEENSYELLHDHDEINAVIEAHAPELSIRAEDSEVVAWIGIRKDSVVALGALCRWESGFHVLSAIVVATSERGKGLGRRITESLVDYSYKNGINYVALGVRADNEAAIATYNRIGFKKLNEFNTFSRK